MTYYNKISERPPIPSDVGPTRRPQSSGNHLSDHYLSNTGFNVIIKSQV